MGLLFHKTNRIPKEEKCLTISDCKISFSHGQNPVLKIINDNETFFFKQFGKPVSRKSFIVEQTYYFCKIIEKSDDYTGDEKQYFKLFLTEFLTKKSIKKIYNSIFDEMAIAVVLKDVFNLNDTDKNYRLCREYIIYLKKVFFISLGKIYSLKNKYDLSFYYRAKSVFELSKSFNIDNLIEEPFVMKIIFENSSKYLLGIATRLCQGKIGEEAGVGITPETYRDLTNLNYLDFLCVQKDHWPHNLVVFS